jgi:hypothetical protein
MNVEIGTEAPIFLFWDYLFQIFGILSLQCRKLNIWWPMPLFLDIYFIYRYSMEFDEEKVYTYNILVGVSLWFCRPYVGLQLECIGAVFI